MKKVVEGAMNEMVVPGYQLVQMDARGNKMRKVSKTGEAVVPHTNATKQKRNASCACGSNKKYKHCCGGVK